MLGWMDDLRSACAAVAAVAKSVRIDAAAIPEYAAGLPLDRPGATAPGAPETLFTGRREDVAAFWLTLDAINFGSGWFPTLKKLPGRSGYDMVAGGVASRFRASGPWSAAELQMLTADELAGTLGQDPAHELMALFAGGLNDLGAHVAEQFSGEFAAVVDGAGRSAVTLARRLGTWMAFADTSSYGEWELPFLKRAQIAAADLDRAGVGTFRDLDRLTMFADNLVPHVLRLDGVLEFDPALLDRIEREDLIEHGSPEEVEIRACAVHAVELIVAARPGTDAARVDQLLWNRGRGARYKAVPRHRSRSTAY